MKFFSYLALLLVSESFVEAKISDFINDLNRNQKHNKATEKKNSKDPILFVKNITVSLHDKNSLLAKEKSLAEAMRCAFNRISRSEFSFSNLENISDNEISNSLKEYTIENEKFSANFYSAEMSFSFFRKSIAEVLKYHGVEIKDEEFFTQSKQKKIIIYLDDYLKNFKELAPLGFQVTNCFNETLTFLMDDSQFENFLKLNIRYTDF